MNYQQIDMSKCNILGNQLQAWNNLQSVHTIAGILPVRVCTPKFLKEQNEFQSAEISVVASVKPDLASISDSSSVKIDLA